MGGLGLLFNGKEAQSPGIFLANCLSVIVYHTCLSCFQPGAGAALGEPKGPVLMPLARTKQGVYGSLDLLDQRICCAVCGIDAVVLWRPLQLSGTAL